MSGRSTGLLGAYDWHTLAGVNILPLNFLFFLKILFIYSLEAQREREREAETHPEEEAGSLQGV